MLGIYDEGGIRFEYPEDWELEMTDDGPVTTISLQAPTGLAFALVRTDEDCPAPAEVADEALEALRAEYEQLDAAPALETIDGHRAVGHDVEFISLDMTNACTIRCFRTSRRTVLVFGQWSDLEGDDAEVHLRRMRRSFEETDPGED
ncbi:MAG: hypothetical protein P4L84_02775 [Isosphaeraceae bacterium]|nr:hypothetical protein [Isosphaeraceae bacterium]